MWRLKGLGGCWGRDGCAMLARWWFALPRRSRYWRLSMMRKNPTNQRQLYIPCRFLIIHLQQPIPNQQSEVLPDPIPWTSALGGLQRRCSPMQSLAVNCLSLAFLTPRGASVPVRSEIGPAVPARLVQHLHALAGLPDHEVHREDGDNPFCP